LTRQASNAFKCRLSQFEIIGFETSWTGPLNSMPLYLDWDDHSASEAAQHKKNYNTSFVWLEIGLAEFR